jgi:hypothetical protein
VTALYTGIHIPEMSIFGVSCYLQGKERKLETNSGPIGVMKNLGLIIAGVKIEEKEECIETIHNLCQLTAC